jgi:hypothetical protein
MRFKHIFYNIVFLSIKLMFIKCFFNNFDILIFKIKKKLIFFYIYFQQNGGVLQIRKVERAVLNLENKMRDLIVNIK